MGRVIRREDVQVPPDETRAFTPGQQAFMDDISAYLAGIPGDIKCGVSDSRHCFDVAFTPAMDVGGPDLYTRIVPELEAISERHGVGLPDIGFLIEGGVKELSWWLWSGDGSAAA